MLSRRALGPLLVAIFVFFAGRSTVSFADEGATAIDFASQIAPILQQHCVRCHSDDNAKGGLSLATFADLETQSLIDVADPDASRLIELVTPLAGQQAEMPKDGTALAAEEVGLLRRWIAEGANWPAEVVVREKSKADASWWSLQPLAVVQPPDRDEPNPIDRFVFARLAANGLQPAEPADRPALVRRLAFDVTGLPPSPDEMRDFVQDVDPLAYDRLVDRLLDSKAYGERMARHWLDIAHYADTHGFERDQRRDHAWHYRDYVIRSFNENKPYNQFLREQIAGDVIAPDNPDSVIATGFLAAGPWDFVGQVETRSAMLRRAARSLDLDDMVTQVMSATIGMTVNCARCHDHKLDPISQSEYYELTAVFAGLKRGDRVVSESSREHYETEKTRLQSAIADATTRFGQLRGEPIDLADLVGGGNGFSSGERGLGIDVRSGRPQERRLGDLDDIRPGKFVPVAWPAIDGVFVPLAGETRISSAGHVATGLPANGGKAWDAIRNGAVNNQFTTRLGPIDYASPGHSMIGLHANAGITFDLRAIREMAKTDLPITFSTVVGYGGELKAPSAEFRILVDGDLRAEGKIGREDASAVEFEIGTESRFLTLISTDGGNGYGHDQISFGDPWLTVQRPENETAESLAMAETLRNELRQLQADLSALAPPPVFYGTTAEKPEPVHILVRGNPETPGDPVNPGTLRLAGDAVTFGDSAMPESDRRLALADWITAPNNPLTARVIVNRLWQWHFGRGIVPTPSDFGYGGQPPSHPDLLDWLAAELIRENWNLKSIHRLICTSQTYQMTSRVAAPLRATQIDSDNRLLWRMNSRRLEAEAIRDAVLAVTGNLSREMGGPGYRDFEYEEAYAPIYRYKTADTPDLWRRSVYRFVVRTTPQPFLATLDCPDPANLTPTRNVTTTALQSLAMFNNDFMLKQSQHFANRLMKESDHLEDRIDLAFRLAFSRPASPEEIEACQTLVDRQGLMHLCRVLLNANEFVNVD